MIRKYQDCTYSAFISYAHADDKATGGWITAFRNELHKLMQGKLHRLPGGAKPMHLSAENGPISGVLSQELKERIEESFFTVVVVHDDYVHSDYCFKEIKWFRDHYGGTGYAERLFILALSERSIRELQKTPNWKVLSPEDQVYIPCYRADDPNRPLTVYLENTHPTPLFLDLLQRLADNMAEKIKDEIATSGVKSVMITDTLDAAHGAVAPAIKETTKVVVGYVHDDVITGRNAIVKTLESIEGMQVHTLDLEALVQGGFQQQLKDADYFVLPFNDANPLLPFAGEGGHLAIQINAWKTVQRDAPSTLANLFTVYMESQCPSTVPAEAMHRTYLDDLRKQSIGAADLEKHLYQKFVDTGSDKKKFIRILIESNPRQTRTWRLLAKRIHKLWSEMTSDLPHPPLIRFKPIAVDELHPPIQKCMDRVGIILLWNEMDDVLAMEKNIDKCEEMLPDDVAIPPCFIAYVTPPLRGLDKPKPAHGWDVIRFRGHGRNSDIREVVEEQEEHEDVKRFLNDFLDQMQTTPASGGYATSGV